MPAPSYEALKAQLATAKTELAGAHAHVDELQQELYDLQKDLDYLSSQAASADRLQLELRRDYDLLFSMVNVMDLGVVTNDLVKRRILSINAVLAGESDATP